MTLNKNNLIQNNQISTDLIRYLKQSKKQYKTLKYKEERELIAKYRNTDDAKMRELLALHNIRIVFSIAKKYAKRTVDFDNIVAKGLYGLTIAANKFGIDTEVTEPVVDREGNPVMEHLFEDGVPKYDKEGNPVMVQKKRTVYEEDGVTPRYIKFITFARSWVFKYIIEEFYYKDRFIDAHAISLDQTPRIKGSEADNILEEQTIDDQVVPEFEKESEYSDLSAIEYSSICKNIRKYIELDESIPKVDKQIFFESYYDRNRLVDIANRHHVNIQYVVNRKKKILGKLKEYLSEKYKISTIDDIRVS